MSPPARYPQHPSMSTGTGIALAAIWLASAAISIFIMLIMFVWNDSVQLKGPEPSDTEILVLLLPVVPIVAALFGTWLILKKD